MTRKERDEIVAMMARNDQFIAEQHDFVQDLAARVLRARQLLGGHTCACVRDLTARVRRAKQRMARGEPLECADVVDALADWLRTERKYLRDARYARRVGEAALRGRIPDNPN